MPIRSASFQHLQEGDRAEGQPVMHRERAAYPSRVHFAESWVYAGTGDEAGARQAGDRVLVGGFGGYQYAANIRLHEALRTVVNGGVDQGAR